MCNLIQLPNSHWYTMSTTHTPKWRTHNTQPHCCDHFSQWHSCKKQLLPLATFYRLPHIALSSTPPLLRLCAGNVVGEAKNAPFTASLPPHFCRTAFKTDLFTAFVPEAVQLIWKEEGRRRKVHLFQLRGAGDSTGSTSAHFASETWHTHNITGYYRAFHNPFQLELCLQSLRRSLRYSYN